jgi:Core-2/I-Branching enzyme
MKIAHLIAVHKNPLQVKRLVDQLLTKDCDIYIHIDKKIDIDSFKAVLSDQRVYFISNRIAVNWGGYSQVKATIVSIKQILENRQTYDYINFISGQDYPIKPLDQFYDYLQLNIGNEYLEYIHAEEKVEETRLRIYKYNFNDFNFKGKYVLQKILNKILPDRKFPILEYKMVVKSNWFTITPECAKYVLDFLDQNPKVVSFFKYGWGVDEFVFQTITYNSYLKDRIVNNNLRYIDWSAQLPSPKTLDHSDIEKLSTSDKFFARKFDVNVDSKILDMLDSKIKTL